MKLIVGLGNPGVKYAKTRHNIGFMFIDKYALIKKCDCFRSKFNGEYAMFNENGENIILFKPHTYMNLSGIAIKEISSSFKSFAVIFITLAASKARLLSFQRIEAKPSGERME